MNQSSHAPWSCALALTLLTALASTQTGPETQPQSRPQSRLATGSVRGVVTDALGEPVPFAELTVLTWQTPATVVAQTRSDSAGVFVASGLPLDGPALRVAATADGRSRTFAHASLAPDRPRAFVRLRLWDAATIRGRVVGKDGKPLAGASVCAAYDEARLFGFDPAAEATADGQGHFELEKVPLGWIQVRAWSPGHVLRTEDLWLADARELELALEPGAGVRLTVRVEGLPRGTPASVSLLPYSKGSHQVLPRPLIAGTTGEDGTWTVEGLPDFEFRASASAAGYTIERPKEGTKPGAAPHIVALRAIPDGTVALRGVLRDLEGRPLSGERIVCRHRSGGRQSHVVTRDDGTFELASPLTPGSEAICHLPGSSHVLAQEKNAEPHGVLDSRSLDRHEFVVKEGMTLDLRATRAAMVRGRVVDRDGRPAAGRAVELQEAHPDRTPRWMGFAYRETDAMGGFVFMGLNPPARELRVAIRGGGNATEEFTLAAGETSKDLQLTVQAGGVIAGKVTDAQGAPIAGARVWLRNWDVATGQQTDGSVIEVLTDRSGRFRHVDVEPGGHRLELHLEDGPSRGAPVTTEPFEVAPGQRLEHSLVAKER